MALRYFFDFDGVLMDSVLELAVTAFNAVRGTQISNVESLPSGYLERFRVNRSFGHEPYEIVLIATWVLGQLERENPVITPEDQNLLRRANPEKEKITKEFFATRRWMLENHRESWFLLNRPFEPLWTELQNLLGHELIIVTTKNKQAVLDLCRYYGLPIEETDIYAGDQLSKKSEHFRSLARRFPGQKMAFLEDSLQNLLEIREELPKEICPELLIARWGYLSEAQLVKAEKEGFKVYGQSDFLDRLKS